MGSLTQQLVTLPAAKSAVGGSTSCTCNELQDHMLNYVNYVTYVTPTMLHMQC